MPSPPNNGPAPEVHWRQVIRRENPHLLYAEDLGGRREVDVEIVDSGVFEVRNRAGGKESSKPMPWLAFRGKQKRLGLNSTNCKAMERLTGTGIVQRWRGWITLVVVRTRYRDQMTGNEEETDAIRISPTRPRAPQPGRDTKPDNLPQGSTHNAAPQWESSDPEMDEQERLAIEAADREGA